MSTLPEFRASERYTTGVELELQLVNTGDYDLSTEASCLLRRVERVEHVGEIKPEITQSMIELNSTVHRRYEPLLEELQAMRDVVAREAQAINIAVCGGGSHPFQQWSSQKLFPTERFAELLEKYGYLAKQFTVFGQHIHIGCGSGDEALRLAHGLARYVPHFIALSASSPFYQGKDTLFDSSRSNVVSAFPLSGTPPAVTRWEDFEAYYDKLFSLGVVGSIKDFYWDVRPKPEYGTVEIRVCDTPLEVERAAALAGFAQALACSILEGDEAPIEPDLYLLFPYNRFQAARHGMRGRFIDPATKQSGSLRADLEVTLRRIAPISRALGCEAALIALAGQVESGETDADWLRATYKKCGSLSDLVRLQAQRWADTKQK